MKLISKAIFILLCLVFAGKVTPAENPSPVQPTGAIVANQSQVPQQQSQDQTDQNTISKDAVKMFIKQVEIYGRIAKPQAVFIIPGTDPKVDGLKIDRQFFDLIFRNVEKSSLKAERDKAAKDHDFIQW